MPPKAPALPDGPLTPAVVKSLNVPTLKVACGRYGLSKTGVKKKLVDRLLEHLATQSKLTADPCALCEGKLVFSPPMGVEQPCPWCVEPQPPATVDGVEIKTELPPEPRANLTGVSAASMAALLPKLTQHNFVLDDALEALRETADTDIAATKVSDAATKRLESFNLNQAQNESEAEGRAAKRRKLELDKEKLQGGDLTPLNDLDADFYNQILECPGIVDWLFADPTAKQSLYDLLVMSNKAAKWYSEPAKRYFKARLDDLLKVGQIEADAVSAWVALEISQLREAVYGFPDAGGQVPALFRAFDDPDVVQDEECAVVQFHQSGSARKDIVVIELD
mmetsp:Transcript_13284/g.33173  ORF Transcript_13284/g.33173 Transcript_13284/m.33173 type:complete len:336 (-) Transcript_13284:390-1397(-)